MELGNLILGARRIYSPPTKRRREAEDLLEDRDNAAGHG
jgi:hypothetical protein